MLGLLDDLYETRRYWELEGEALDLTQWRIQEEVIDLS